MSQVKLSIDHVGKNTIKGGFGVVSAVAGIIGFEIKET